MPCRAPALAASLAALVLGVPAVAECQEARGLMAELGCAACHTGLGATPIRERAPAFDGATPLEPVFVFEYLGDPTRRRTDIGSSRMPDFQLDEGERLALALYLGNTGQEGRLADVRTRHPDVDAERGGAMFRMLGCGNCHAHPEAEPRSVGPDLANEGARVREEWLRAWLATPTPIRTPGHATAPGARMPDFRLSQDELEAVVGALVTAGSLAADMPSSLSPHRAGRTERLVRDRLACLGCHERDGEGGALGPSLTGIADRLLPAFVHAMVRDPQTAAPGSPMPRQRMPEREAQDVAAWLLEGTAGWRGTERRSLADPTHPAWAFQAARAGAATREGGETYAQWCAACHGATGRGDGWNAPRLPVSPTAHADAETMRRRPDDTLYDGIHAGAWVLDGNPRMPPFGDLLNDRQIRELVAYIRTLCDCAQPGWAGGAS